MNSTTSRRGLSVSSWLLIILVMLLAGAAAAVWTLARHEGVARFFGVVPQPVAVAPLAFRADPPGPTDDTVEASQRLADAEARLARLESATRQAAGSAGRTDALLIAFAARRAVDRGVALGYLEPLLIDRFGQTHRAAVATIITGSRSPVSLEQLSAELDALAPTLQGGGPDEGLWEGMKRELGSLISVRRGDRPNPRPSATYERARARLAAGQVDKALAEAMRLPGISRAQPWVTKARNAVAVQRALDEIESAALLGGTR